ncbi:MAG: hypothetical protein ACYCV7_09165 [Acidimicrobiales bacterium]
MTLMQDHAQCTTLVTDLVAGTSGNAQLAGSANLGATRLATAAGALEHLAATGDIEGAEVLTTAIATHCRRALDALAEETGRPVGHVDDRPWHGVVIQPPSKGAT